MVSWSPWSWSSSPPSPDAGDLWIDYVFYRDIGVGWLQDGSYYLPHQLSGVPYDLAPMADVLYPPHALFLFVPLVFVPAIVWWAIPIAVIAYAVWRWRPAPWAWAAMIVLLMWPRANAAFLFGNTDMWMAAGVAAGLIWGWPALILTLKPTLLPFALLGANRRAWWAGSVVLLVVGVAMIPLWLDYVTALRTVHIGLDYSLGSLPLVLVPMVAWLGRQAAGDRWRSTPGPDQGGRGHRRRRPAAEPRERDDRAADPDHRDRADDPQQPADRQQCPDLRGRRHGRQQIEREHDAEREAEPAHARLRDEQQQEDRARRTRSARASRSGSRTRSASTRPGPG